MLDASTHIMYKGNPSPSWDMSSMLNSVEDLIFKVRSDKKKRAEEGKTKSKPRTNKRSQKVRS